MDNPEEAGRPNVKFAVAASRGWVLPQVWQGAAKLDQAGDGGGLGTNSVEPEMVGWANARRPGSQV